MASPVEVFRVFFKILSTIAGIFFLCKSSFSQMQFGEDGDLKTFGIAVVSALVVTFIFVVPILRRQWIAEDQGNNRKPVAISISFVVVAVLLFLIKYPRFNIHSEYSRSCVNEQRENMAPGSEYNLFSAAAFSLFSLFISFRRKEAGVLGFFTILLGLTIDASIEINGTHGPNFSYIGAAALFCVALIFLGCYAESLRGNPGRQEARNRIVQITEHLELPSAAAAVACLSFGAFSKLQFQNSSNLEVACLTVFSLLLGACRNNLPGWIDKMVKECSNPLVTAALNSLLLLITSVLIFLNKFPRFNIHSKYREFCTEKEEKSINDGSLFDLYSVGAFALLASLISSEQPYDRRQSFESGIFSFLVELTMDASIETLENKKPNIRYVMFAFMYCVGVIFLKACFSPDQQNDGAGGGGGGGGRGEDPDDDLETQLLPILGIDDRNGRREADGNGGGDNDGNGGGDDINGDGDADGNGGGVGGNGGGDNDGNGGGNDRNGGGDDNDGGDADRRGGDENGREGSTGDQSGVSSSYPQAEEDWEIVPENDGGGDREGQGHDIGETASNIQSLDSPVHEKETLLPGDGKSVSATGLRSRISRSIFGGRETNEGSPSTKAKLQTKGELQSRFRIERGQIKRRIFEKVVKAVRQVKLNSTPSQNMD